MPLCAICRCLMLQARRIARSAFNQNTPLPHLSASTDQETGTRDQGPGSRDHGPRTRDLGGLGNFRMPGYTGLVCDRCALTGYRARWASRRFPRIPGYKHISECPGRFILPGCPDVKAQIDARVLPIGQVSCTLIFRFDGTSVGKNRHTSVCVCMPTCVSM